MTIIIKKIDAKKFYKNFVSLFIIKNKYNTLYNLFFLQE